MSAWGKIHANEEPVSFDTITSEQLARSLQEKYLMFLIFNLIFI
jgi:hypothetical protein